MISIYKLQNVLPYYLIKQVNKIIGIRNLKIWLFNDVSKIKIRKMNTIFNQNITFFSILSKNSFAKRSYYINYFLSLTQDSNLSQKSQSILQKNLALVLICLKSLKSTASSPVGVVTDDIANCCHASTFLKTKVCFIDCAVHNFFNLDLFHSFILLKRDNLI